MNLKENWKILGNFYNKNTNINFKLAMWIDVLTPIL